MALRRSLGNTPLDDAVDGAGDMRAEIHPRLLPSGAVDLATDLRQPRDDLLLLFLPAPEEAKHPTFELLHHRPPERQPQPAVARMPQKGRAQVRARSLLSFGYGGINESGDSVEWLWNRRHLFFSQGAFPFLTTGAVAGAAGTVAAVFGSCLSIVAPPSSGLKPFTSLLSSYCPSAGLTATLI